MLLLLVIPHMAATARAGPGQSGESNSTWVSNGGTGAAAPGPPFAASPGHELGTGLELEQLGLKWMSVRDAGTVGGGLTRQTPNNSKY